MSVVHNVEEELRKFDQRAGLDDQRTGHNDARAGLEKCGRNIRSGSFL